MELEIFQGLGAEVIFTGDETFPDDYLILHVKFPNGRVLSTIRGVGSMGYRSGLFETAEMRDGEVVDESVDGWLTEADVVANAHALAALPPAPQQIQQ